MKLFFRLFVIIFLFVSYVIYQDLQIQKKEYAKDIQFFLQTACESLITNQYGHHASLSGYNGNQDNKLLSKENGFDVFNNLIYMYLKHTSTLYYQDYAPQEIICTAHLVTNGELSNMTSVNFHIDGPRYIPTLEQDLFRSSQPIILTIAKIKKMIIYNWPSSLKKPEFKFSKYFLSN